VEGFFLAKALPSVLILWVKLEIILLSASVGADLFPFVLSPCGSVRHWQKGWCLFTSYLYFSWTRGQKCV